MQTTYLGDEERQREREQSLESVSPKTIPRPTPQRHSASYSQEPPVDTRPPPHPSQPHLHPHAHQVQPTSQMAIDKSMDGHPQHTAEFSSRPSEHHEHSTMSSGPNSAPRTRNSVTPQSVHSSLPAQPSPPLNKQPSLKRSNSILSTPPSSAMPPRKRLRRDEIPIFARSARRGKPIRFSHQGPNIRTSRKSPAPAPKREDDMLPVTNGQASMYGLTELTVPSKPCKEPSITNLVPYDDIVRKVCDWIALTASKKMPPPGSKFELEAKLGRILDQDTSERIRLPVLNEAILDRSCFGAIRFVSTMTEVSNRVGWLCHLTDIDSGAP